MSSEQKGVVRVPRKFVIAQSFTKDPCLSGSLQSLGT